MGNPSKRKGVEWVKFYNKLVRDNIPEILLRDGIQCETEVLHSGKYMNKLNHKLTEELGEYFGKEDVEELVDLVEVIYAILEFKGVSIEEFEKMRLAKKMEKGGFEKRVLLVRAGKPGEAGGVD